MSNPIEIAQLFKLYGELGIHSNSIREFAWVVRQVVQEDLQQAAQALNEVDDIGFRSIFLTYLQRTLEVGYIFTEVFLREEYEQWQPATDTPRVIDLGGDPGSMSVLYWKHRAPQALVTVVEANPATVNVMRRNLQRRGITDVEVINAAISGNLDGQAVLNLHRPGKGYHTQDFAGDDQVFNVNKNYRVEIPKITLSSLIEDNEIIDLLKVDIEGAETVAMKELAESGKLPQVRQILMEYHHSAEQWPNNSLETMLLLLADNGFVIKEAHITAGTGLRKKTNLAPSAIADLAHHDDVTFLTFSAEKNP